MKKSFLSYGLSVASHFLLGITLVAASAEVANGTPTIPALGASVASNSLVDFEYTGSLQKYTVRNSGYYYLEAGGAAGGDAPANGASGGRGAIVSTTTYLSQGDILKIAVGGQGAAATNCYYGSFGGGGGGTYVYDSPVGNDFTNQNLFLVASGGGGAVTLGKIWGGSNYPGLPGLATNDYNGSGGNGLSGGGNTVPQIHDQVSGYRSSVSGSGGNGWKSAFANNMQSASNAAIPANVLTYSDGIGGTFANGGYGGGGWGIGGRDYLNRLDKAGAGGGGGYTGGDAGIPGGGGSSYCIANFNSAMSGTNSGNGYFLITDSLTIQTKITPQIFSANYSNGKKFAFFINSSSPGTLHFTLAPGAPQGTSISYDANGSQTFDLLTGGTNQVLCGEFSAIRSALNNNLHVLTIDVSGINTNTTNTKSTITVQAVQDGYTNGLVFTPVSSPTTVATLNLGPNPITPKVETVLLTTNPTAFKVVPSSKSKGIINYTAFTITTASGTPAHVDILDNTNNRTPGGPPKKGDIAIPFSAVEQQLLVWDRQDTYKYVPATPSTTTQNSYTINPTNGSLSITNLNTIFVYATQTADSKYNEVKIPTLVDIINVFYPPPILTPKPPQTVTYSSGLTATVLPTSPSQGAFTFSLAPGAPLGTTINSNTGIVSIGGAGTITVLASQASDGSYTAATNLRTAGIITVPKGSQTISFPTISNQIFSNPNSNSFSITLPTSSAALPVAPPSLSPTNLATLSSNRITMLGGSGWVTLTASQTGNSNYQAASSVTNIFHIQGPPPTKFGTGTNMITLQFSPVGSSSNAPDSNNYGSVPYKYQIGTYDIAQDQIVKAIAGGLQGMSTTNAWSKGQPATGLTWYQAAAFVNWLNTNKGYAPAYNLTYSNGTYSMALWPTDQAWTQGGTNLYRRANCVYFLPSDNEWYKAAYYNPTVSKYFLYPTGSNIAPTPVSSGTNAGTAVYDSLTNGPAAVTNAGGLSPLQTMGQGGNVDQWLETSYTGINNDPASGRKFEGGNWTNTNTTLQSLNMTNGTYAPPQVGKKSRGFRVASQQLVPIVAENYSNSIPVTNYGFLYQKSLNTSNNTSNNLIGNTACIPTSSVNALTYLQNTYPTIFGTNLTGSSYSNWVSTDTNLVKIYQTLPPPNNTNANTSDGTSTTNFLSGIASYINSKGFSNNIALLSDYSGIPISSSNNHEQILLFLETALNNKAAVQLSLSETNGIGGHNVVLNGLQWNASRGTGTISFVDPMNPATSYTGTNPVTANAPIRETTGTIIFDNNSPMGITLNYFPPNNSNIKKYVWITGGISISYHQK